MMFGLPSFFIPQYNININEPEVERPTIDANRTVQYQNKLINWTAEKEDSYNKINSCLSIVLCQT